MRAFLVLLSAFLCLSPAAFAQKLTQRGYLETGLLAFPNTAVEDSGPGGERRHPEL